MIGFHQFIFLIVSALISGSKSLQFFFGDCPIYFEEPCQTNLIKFQLTTNFGKTIHLDPFEPQLPSNFDIFIPTKILIHGYGGLTLDSAIKNVSEAYKNIGYNTILVDWEPLSLTPCYVTAYLNTWHVGQCIAILMISLLEFGISPSTVHMIGFSLGAHIAGFAGAHLQKTLGIPLQRITGLDPALPFFATLKHDWKLNRSNARFVDVIHTSAGSFGKIEAAGHVDFYVNGGSLQPACYEARCKYRFNKFKKFVKIQPDNIELILFGFGSI